MTAAPFDFDWLTPQLAVGGGFACRAAERLARDGIRAVIDMRAEASDDAAALAQQGIAALRLPTEDHHASDPRLLAAGIAFAREHLDRGDAVLIHCQHGIGRAPLLALCVLVTQGLAPLDALALAKERRERVSPSPAQYEAWAAWLRRYQAQVGATWTVPAFEAFARIAYRHLTGVGR